MPSSGPSRPGQSWLLPAIWNDPATWYCGWRARTRPGNTAGVNGELCRLGHRISEATVRRILRALTLEAPVNTTPLPGSARPVTPGPRSPPRLGITQQTPQQRWVTRSDA